MHSGRNKKQVSTGDVAGCINSAGYWSIKYKGKSYPVHRIIWQMFASVIPKGKQIDHVDRNRLNNDISNLRLVTQAVNSRNRSKRSDNTSGHTGINELIDSSGIYHKARWVDINGRERSKTFRGSDSLDKAIAYRASMIGTLNEKGSGYTCNHGV